MNLTKEDLQRIVKEELEAVLDEKWSEKYKRSIDCKNPKGFSQRAHCDGRKKNEANVLSEDKEIIDKINGLLNSGDLGQVIYGINFAGTMGYPIESIDIHGLIKNLPNDDMYGAAIEISDAMLENYEEYYNQFVDDAMRSQRGFRKDPNEITENDKIKLFLGFLIHLKKEAQVYPNVKEEAKAYHWDEPDWHYDGGYGDPEGPDSKWYITEEELEEKKRKLTYKPGSESSLRDWFGRKGAKGKKKGWVDCNAPDGKGGYKSCGRGEGEKRKKYPACRPTPGACKKMKGSKGKSWGKKAKKGKKG